MRSIISNIPQPELQHQMPPAAHGPRPRGLNQAVTLACSEQRVARMYSWKPLPQVTGQIRGWALETQLYSPVLITVSVHTRWKARMLHCGVQWVRLVVSLILSGGIWARTVTCAFAFRWASKWQCLIGRRWGTSDVSCVSVCCLTLTNNYKREVWNAPVCSVCAPVCFLMYVVYRVWVCANVYGRY